MIISTNPPASDLTDALKSAVKVNRQIQPRKVVLAGWIRSDVLGIFPNDDAITRLIGALLVEQNDEWAVQREYYMSLETIAPLSDDQHIKLPAIAA